MINYGELLGGVDPQYFRQLPYSEEKAKLIRGNYNLAAVLTYQWYAERWQYIKQQAKEESGVVAGRYKAYQSEVEEVEEAKKGNWKTIITNRKPEIPWYLDEVASEIWKVASEWADVAIIGASILRTSRYAASDVAKWWGGEECEAIDPVVVGYLGLIAQYRRDAALIKLDLAEIVITKIANNDQHYSLALRESAHLRRIVDGKRLASFGSALRLGVGDPLNYPDSQMPDMVMHPVLGELVTAVLQKSAYSVEVAKRNRAWNVEGGNIVVPVTTDLQHYNLYMGV